MSDLPEEAMEQLAVYDDYPRDYTPFQVGDETVLAGDDRLAEAPRAIPERERGYHSFVSVPRIGGPRNRRPRLNRAGIARRTVNTHRQNAYRLLKKLMGVSDEQLQQAATAMSNATHTRMIPYPVIEAACPVHSCRNVRHRRGKRGDPSLFQNR